MFGIFWVVLRFLDWVCLAFSGGWRCLGVVDFLLLSECREGVFKLVNLVDGISLL